MPYVTSLPQKVAGVRRCLRRWRALGVVDVAADFMDRVNQVRRLRDLDAGDRERVAKVLGQGLRVDAVEFMARCMGFYAKRHRFRFEPDVMTGIRDSSLGNTSFDTIYPVYSATVECVEDKLRYFRDHLQSPRVRSRQSSRLGAFNLFVQEQWRDRRDELLGLCRATRSTDVMRKLGREWQLDASVRGTYRSRVANT